MQTPLKAVTCRDFGIRLQAAPAGFSAHRERTLCPYPALATLQDPAESLA